MSDAKGFTPEGCQPDTTIDDLDTMVDEVRYENFCSPYF